METEAHFQLSLLMDLQLINQLCCTVLIMANHSSLTQVFIFLFVCMCFCFCVFFFLCLFLFLFVCCFPYSTESSLIFFCINSCRNINIPTADMSKSCSSWSSKEKLRVWLQVSKYRLLNICQYIENILYCKVSVGNYRDTLSYI